MQPHKINEQLDHFKSLLYGDEDTVLEQGQFLPLQQLMSSLASEASLLPYLSKLLPLSLKLFDHHDINLKLVGVVCVDIIVTNVPHHHLAHSGTDFLLMDSLSKSLSHPDSKFLMQVIPLTVRAAQLFCLKINKLEDLFLQIHDMIERTDEINKKACLWSAVSPMLKLLGPSTIKFVSHYLMPLISDQLSYPLVVIRDGKSTSEDNVVSLFSETIQSMITMIQMVPAEVFDRHLKPCILILSKFIYCNSSFFSQNSSEDQTAASILLRERITCALELFDSFDHSVYQKCINLILFGVEAVVKEDSPSALIQEKLFEKKKALETLFGVDLISASMNPTNLSD